MSNPSPLSGFSVSRLSLLLMNSIGTKKHTNRTSIVSIYEPQCDLYDLCLEMRWNDVIAHCTQRPIDAYYEDGDYLETPLYLACQHRPPQAVVEALLIANPTAIYERSRVNGDIPIHIACRYNASINVLRVLVQADPGTASQPTMWGCTPIRALWDGRMYQEGYYTTEELVTDIISLSNAMTSTTTLPKTCPIYYQSMFWRKVDVLIEAVAYYRQKQELQSTDTLYIVHAAVALGTMACPIEVLNYCIHKYPEQVRMRDKNGQLPFHIAIGTPAKCVTVKVAETTTDQIPKTLPPWSTRNQKIRPNEGKVITTLLDFYPEAAKLFDPTEPNGRYPLHTAIRNKHSWNGGVQKIVECYPQVLKIRDPVDHLYPFQISNSFHVSDIDTTYSLLHMDPTALLLR